MRILRLKPARFKQWLEVLEEERHKLTWRVALQMIWFAIQIPFTCDRRLWARRIRTCRRCIVYDCTLRRCRPFTGSEMGCGCFVVFKALPRSAKCWAREKAPEAGIGWEK